MNKCINLVNPVLEFQFPKTASAVIVGGGVAGLSVAYHLSKLGWQDIILLERKQIASGTTWHAAGLVRSNIGSATLTRIAKEAQPLFSELEAATGQITGFKQNGSLGIANNTARWEEHRRAYSFAHAMGVEAHLIDAREAGRHWPFLETSDLLGALWYPHDGQVNPLDFAQALAKGARQNGVQIIEGVKVTAIRSTRGRVTGVKTTEGEIESPIVVNAAGMWAHEFARLADIPVPVQACEHFYVVTEPVEGLPSTLPVLRDMDGCAYYKEDAGKLLIGAFEPKAKPWGLEGIPDEFCFDELPEDFDHFQPILEQAMRRVPILEKIGIRKFFNGPEGFTPDQRYYLGETAELLGFYVLAGFNSIGIQSGGGAGKALAEWIDCGEMPFDLTAVDAQRALHHETKPSFLIPRVSEALGLLYAMHWPGREFETSRNVVLSPLHNETEEAGAVYGAVSGKERPNWYAKPGQKREYVYSYGRANWFENVALEHSATRRAVGLFDQSSFGKFLVKGRDAVSCLERLSTNSVSISPGRTIYTQWLNSRGGIEADLTVTRLEDEQFLVTTGAAVSKRDLTRLNRMVQSFERVTVKDVSNKFAVIGVMGPYARDFLQPITETSLDHSVFRFGASKLARVAGMICRLTRISYVGELGWEISCLADDAPKLWRALSADGQGFGAVPAGMYAMNTLRLEKGYRHWGHDISPEDNPFEAGLEYFLRLEKNVEFVGQSALMEKRELEPRRRLMAFRLDDPGPLLHGNEPIFIEGTCVGWLTSGGFGHSLGVSIGLGYASVVKLDGAYEIEIAGERFPAVGSLKPLYEPENPHLRA